MIHGGHALEHLGFQVGNVMLKTAEYHAVSASTWVRSFPGMVTKLLAITRGSAAHTHTLASVCVHQWQKGGVDTEHNRQGHIPQAASYTRLTP